MKKIILLLTCICSLNFLYSQKIVSVTHQETLTPTELASFFLGLSVDYGIEAFKVLYETTDTDGSIDTVSGLLVLPLKEHPDEAFPFLAYQHGTVSARDQVPSNINNFERRIAYFFAGQGYYTTAADYLGLGDSRRAIHPYVHAATEASAAIDLVKAAKSYLEGKLPYSRQLFITGYSQGGHAGMAMHEVLNENPIPELPVVAGSHMSGIYNVSGELAAASISAEVYQFPSYPVWIILGYQSVYGNLYNELSDVFQPDYIPIIQDFLNDTITRGRLNELLVDKLVENHEASIPKFMFTDAFINALESTSDNPIRLALKDNDLFNWVPTSPMQMVYCMADDQVSFTNSTFTDSLMNANGAANVTAVDVNSTADHGGCIVPATFSTLLFFEQFAERSLILGTNDVDQQLAFSAQPNPATDYINLSFNGLSNKFDTYELRLLNMNGQIVRGLQTNNLENFRFPLNEISSGLYLMQVQSKNGFWTEKIIIR